MSLTQAADESLEGQILPQIEWPSSGFMPCMYCKLDMLSPVQYVKHLHTNHSMWELQNDRVHYCPYCPHSGNQWNNVKAHIGRHFGVLPYHCPDFIEVPNPADPTSTVKEKCTFVSVSQSKMISHRAKYHGFSKDDPRPSTIYALDDHARSTAIAERMKRRKQDDARKLTMKPYWRKPREICPKTPEHHGPSYASSSAVTLDSKPKPKPKTKLPRPGRLSRHESVFHVAAGQAPPACKDSAQSGRFSTLSLSLGIPDGRFFPLASSSSGAPPSPVSSAPSSRDISLASLSRGKSSLPLPTQSSMSPPFSVDGLASLAQKFSLSPSSYEWLSIEAKQMLYADLLFLTQNDLGLGLNFL